MILGARDAQVAAVEPTLRGEDLGMADHHRVATGAAHAQPRPPGEILAEVDQVRTRAEPTDRRRAQRPRRAERRGERCGERGRGIGAGHARAQARSSTPGESQPLGQARRSWSSPA